MANSVAERISGIAGALAPRQRLKRFLGAWFGFVGLIVLFQVIQMLPAFHEAQYDVRMPVCLRAMKQGEDPEFLTRVMQSAGVEDWSLGQVDHPLEGCDGFEQRILGFESLLSRRSASDLFKKIQEGGPAAGIYSRGLSYNTSPAGTGTVSYAVSVFTAAVLALVFWWVVRSRGTVGKDVRGGTRETIISALSATVVAFVAAIVYGLFLQLVGVSRVPGQPSLQTLTPSLLLAAVVFAPVAEEVIFRFWLLDRMIPAIGSPAALLLSSVVFSAIHMDLEPFAFGSRLITGLALGLLWLRTFSLGACVLAHGLFNAAVIALDRMAWIDG